MCFYRGVTFASKITIARICLVPVYVTLAFSYGYTVKSGLPVESLRWWALGVFVTAAATDGVDGWIARKFNQCSKFGAYIDPIADKALLITGVITLSLIDWGAPGWRLPLWFAAIVVIRDCIILGGIKVLYRHHREVKIIPHWIGKVCTVAQMFAIGWVMLRVTEISPNYPCAIAGVFTIWSSIAYIRQGQKILKGAGKIL
jgi:CDP-diacylglycerol--glycerol-3-phosphate 3-phosphatidyltransferase